MDEVEKKFNNYLNLLEKRTINSIDNLNIKESCTATLLLLFAAVDSLSKITCSDDDYESYKKNRGNKPRFEGFLDKVMGNRYAAYKDKIYELRNDIVHTGINTKVILSKNQDHKTHLIITSDGCLWINTNQFLDDFKKAIEKIRNDIHAKGQFYQNANERIIDFNIIEIEEEPDLPFPSPGPDEEPFNK